MLRLFLLRLVLLVQVVEVVFCQDATLFDHGNFQGDSVQVFNLGNGKCQNFLNFNDRTSSVRTNTCIRLWADIDCTGRSLDVNPSGQDNLVRNNFNDELTSVSNCQFNSQANWESVEIVMHLNGANDLEEHASKMRKMMTEWFPFIRNNLLSPFYNEVRRIDVYFDVKDNGIYAIGREIHIPIQYVRNNKGDTGVFIHEMTHVIHQARRCPGWIVEGMAEYMRRWFYEPKTTAIKPTNRNLDNDYLGDWLLAYLNSVVGRPIIYMLNRACQEGTYSDNLLRDLTGKDPKEWWRIMIDDRSFPWKRLN